MGARGRDSPERWIQNATTHPGALRRELHTPKGELIDPGLLNRIDKAGIGGYTDGYHITTKLWRRAHAAVNMRKRRG